MLEIVGLFIGIAVLLVGIPIGSYLAKLTKEELSQGQSWFKLIIVKSFLGVIISLILRNDTFFFSFLFIAIVTSMSLKKRRKRK